MRTTAFVLIAFVSVLVAVGVAAAAQPNASVSISASRSVVVYGQTVNLSGSVSKQAGEKVTVMSEASDKTAFSDLATVDTLAGGAWSYTATPTIQTAYQAKWKGTLSRAATVKVRPAITLKLVNAASGGFSVTVTAARSFAGKFVLVQRLARSGVSTLKHVTLGAGSAASFSVRLHHGLSRLRVVMPTSQTAPGYIAGSSNVVSVTH